MKKKDKIFRNTVNSILNYIKKSPYIYSQFYNKTKNRKYTINELLICILKLLKTGIVFRDAPLLCNYDNICWSTIYKFYRKLIKYNIIESVYKKTVNKYLSTSKNKIYLTDTTLIPNKMGIDKIGFNPQLKKHKTSKISYITTNKGAPINTFVTSGNHYDSRILIDQLNQTPTFFKDIKTQNNSLLGDAGYDSAKIRKILAENNFGKIICPRNPRNIKDSIKLAQLKLSDKEKHILKKRYKVEHIFSHLKSFKRISLRYDKNMSNYSNFVTLATLMIFLKKTKRNKRY